MSKNTGQGVEYWYFYDFNESNLKYNEHIWNMNCNFEVNSIVISGAQVKTICKQVMKQLIPSNL